jgi:hypothetical protein
LAVPVLVQGASARTRFSTLAVISLWTMRLMFAVVVLALLPSAATAQSIIGTWLLDPFRSKIAAPDGGLIDADQLFTIDVVGTEVVITAPNSTAGLPLPRSSPSSRRRVSGLVLRYDFNLRPEVRVFRGGGIGTEPHDPPYLARRRDAHDRGDDRRGPHAAGVYP